jgi:anti-anti-sigma regulatory factor
MTTTKTSGKRKSSTGAKPKRTIASATRAVPAVNPAVPTVRPEAPTASPAAPTVSPAVVPVASPAAEANSVSAAVGVTAVTAATAAQTNGEVGAALHVQLEPSLEIKDAEDVHRLLSAALVERRAIAVDVGRVQAVDAAGAQLLLAFQGEASRRGVTIEFRGESAPLLHTLAVLGLRDKLSFAVPHDG